MGPHARNHPERKNISGLKLNCPQRRARIINAEVNIRVKIATGFKDLTKLSHLNPCTFKGNL